MTILDIPAVTIGSVTLSPAFLLGLAAAVLLLPILTVVIVALRAARAHGPRRSWRCMWMASKGQGAMHSAQPVQPSGYGQTCWTAW